MTKKRAGTATTHNPTDSPVRYEPTAPAKKTESDEYHRFSAFTKALLGVPKSEVKKPA